MRSAADVICHESTAGAQHEGSKALGQDHTLGIAAAATCSFLGTDAASQRRKPLRKQSSGGSVPTGRRTPCPAFGDRPGCPLDLVWCRLPLGPVCLSKPLPAGPACICMLTSERGRGMLLASGFQRHSKHPTCPVPAKHLEQSYEAGRRNKQPAQFRDRRGTL